MERNNIDLGNILHIAFGVENIEKASKRIAEVFQTEIPQINDPKESDEKYPVYCWVSTDYVRSSWFQVSV